MHLARGAAQEVHVLDADDVVGQRRGVDRVGTAAGEQREHGDFLLGSGVGHDGFHHETVHLRFGQVERALFLDGILGGDHHERFRQRDALAADRGGAFGHGLEHRRLGLGVGSVDLVKQHEVGVDWADLCGEALRGEVEDLRAHKVGGHEVRCALHAFERSGDGGGQGLCRGRLGEARHGFDEDVAAGHHRGDQGFAQVLLTHECLGEAVANPAHELLGAGRVIGAQRGGGGGCRGRRGHGLRGWWLME